jgi:hypothetical protein
MGRLIEFESLRAEYEEQLRDRALMYFPWDAMDEMKRTEVFPLIRYWPRVKQNIVIEAMYRLVYDAYVWGMRSAKMARSIRLRVLPREPWERVYAHAFTKEGYELVQSCFAQFAVQHWLEGRALIDVYTLGEGFVAHWFCHGVVEECKRSQQGSQRKV